MKKVFVIFLILFSIVALTSCSKTKKKTLINRNLYRDPYYPAEYVQNIPENDSTYQKKQRALDSIDGFRNFKFYSQISDYYSYDIKTIYEKPNNYSMYEINILEEEDLFLDTEIQSILVETYKGKIFLITLLLNNDIGPILEGLFYLDKLGGDVFSYNNAIKYAKSKNKYNHDFGYYFNNDDVTCYKLYIGTGKNIHLLYGHFLEKNTGSASDPFYSEKYIVSKYFLSFYSKDYKDSIDTKLLDEHYDIYLSDLGADYYPKTDTTKKTYNIPLFEINNTYYIRALFSDFVDNILLDTGADQLIISKKLYNKLKTNDMVIDTDQTLLMQAATGDTVSLHKIVLKSIQLNDLNVKNAIAYINTSDDISLLGQSFLKRFGKITIDHKLNILTIER